MEPIQLDFWEPVPEKPGFVQRVAGRKIVDVHAELIARLRDAAPDYEGCSLAYRWTLAPGADVSQHRWPATYHWIACYAVTGSNEGHYVHVDLVDQDGRTIPMFLIKSFLGREHAQRIAALCAEWLDA